MTARNGFRSISDPSVSKRAQRWEAGNTTGGWQDKRAHVALRLGGCFCLGFWLAPHVVALMRTVRRKPMPLSSGDVLHVAGLRHER